MLCVDAIDKNMGGAPDCTVEGPEGASSVSAEAAAQHEKIRAARDWANVTLFLAQAAGANEEQLKDVMDET